MDRDLRGVVIGFAAAVVVLAGLVWFAGVSEVIAALAGLRLRHIGLLVLASLVWLTMWGLSLQTVLRVLDVKIGVVSGFLLYATATFSNNVTPFGQAGGEPLSALLISRATAVDYERGLAAIASVDALNFAPSIVLAILGLGYYLTAVTLGDKLVFLLGMVAAVGVGIPVIGYGLWLLRDKIERLTVGVLTPVISTVGQVIPRFSGISREAIRARVNAFYRDIERVADSRRNLALALGFSMAGWLAMVGALWVALMALVPPNGSILLAAALVAVPVGAIASVTPLPGGLGGVEFALVLVIVPISGLTTDTATAATLVYRGAIYWLPTIIGGLAAAWLQGKPVRVER